MQSKMNIQMFSSSPSSAPTQSGNLSTPTQNGNRSTSRELSPQPNGGSQHASSSPNADATQWSSAVGFAATSGKSGRVIEKLQSEVDRLNRELKIANSEKDEQTRNAQAMRQAKEAVQTSHDNLAKVVHNHTASIARHDRQMSEMRDSLNDARTRRTEAETRCRQVQAERDEAVESRNRDVGQLTERTKYAENTAEILEKTHRQLKNEYSTRVQSLRTEIAAEQKAKVEDQQKLARLEVVNEQMRQNFEQMTKAHEEMVSKWDELKSVTEKRVEEVEGESSAEASKARKLSTEMDQVVKQMRWVMNVKKNTDLDGSSGSG